MKLFTTFFLITIIALNIVSVSVSAENILPPKHQTAMGVSPNDVICKEGLELLIKKGDNMPACIKPESSERLLERGWAKTIVKSAIEMRDEVLKIGEITILEIVENTTEEIISDTNFSIIFEICSEENDVIEPEILIISDTETKSEELELMLEPNTCSISSAVITAKDQESIKAFLVNTSNLPFDLSELQSRIEVLQEEIDLEIDEIKSLVESEHRPEGYESKISKITDKIINLREELNDARLKLQMKNYILHEASSLDIDYRLADVLKGIQKERPVHEEEPVINIVSIVKVESGQTHNLSSPNEFDVIFELCTKLDEIRFPVVILWSDVEINLEELGFSIEQKTCQISSSIILANDEASIHGIVVTEGEQTNLIEEYEKQIVDLEDQILTEKALLDELIIKSQTENSEQQIIDLTEKIIDLRNELNDARKKLAGLNDFIG